LGREEVDDGPLRKALIAWASEPENLPHDVAIKDGIPYLMKDTEARLLDIHPFDFTQWGDVKHLAFAPGQRERVEKWRASQAKKGKTGKVYLNGVLVGEATITNMSFEKPLPPVLPRGFSGAMTGSFDGSGVVYCLGIDEAILPGTTRIVKLKSFFAHGQRQFGYDATNCVSLTGTNTATGQWKTFFDRCIAYREHVLEREASEFRKLGPVLFSNSLVAGHYHAY
jgi:hypothetical protein